MCRLQCHLHKHRCADIKLFENPFLHELHSTLDGEIKRLNATGNFFKISNFNQQHQNKKAIFGRKDYFCCAIWHATSYKSCRKEPDSNVTAEAPELPVKHPCIDSKEDSVVPIPTIQISSGSSIITSDFCNWIRVTSFLLFVMYTLIHNTGNFL